MRIATKEQLGLRFSEERGKLGASELQAEKLDNALVVMHEVPCVHVLNVQTPNSMVIVQVEFR